MKLAVGPHKAMAALDDVYKEFGRAAEHAQHFESALGSVLLVYKIFENEAKSEPNLTERYYQDILRGIDRNTLGALLRKVRENISVRDDLTRVFELTIEDPDGNEMRWYQVLTSDTQVTGERQQP